MSEVKPLVYDSINGDARQATESDGFSIIINRILTDENFNVLCDENGNVLEG